MIVIATHNGHDRLNDLLNDLKEHKCNIPISIIDTQFLKIYYLLNTCLT